MTLKSCITAGLLWISSAAAFAMGQCPLPQINIDIKAGEPPVLRSKSIKDLGNLHLQSSESLGSAHTMGMYNAQIAVFIESQASLRSRLFSEMQLCPTQVDVKISVGHKIYIASEIPSNSCAFSETLAHEKMHETAQINAITRMKGEIRQIVLANMFQLFGKDEKSLSNKFDGMQKDISKIISHAISISTAGVHNQIDTEKEYDRVSRSCGGEFQSIVKNR